MRMRHNPLYHLLDRDYYESFDLYRPRLEDFHELVLSKLPCQWQIKRSGIWFHCSGGENNLPKQGWKIHVCATRKNARNILDRVSSILFAAGDSDFKFALDLPTLFFLNSKNWPRGASGKFITIYPASNHRFLELIEELHQATRDLQGPYILSDHRYKDSCVVFYRYGGMRLQEAVDISGERTPLLMRPDGGKIPDQRMAYPTTPTWAEMAIPTHEQSEAQQGPYLLCEGRFEIAGVIEFSNAGGVYRGKDCRTGAQVIVKEARPHIEVSGGDDAVSLLKKEYRFLKLLADTGVAPQPVALFQEDTHWFLVEEFIQGVSLLEHSAAHNILLRTRPAEEDFRVWYRTFRKIALRLFKMVRILHDRNIVFSDLSTSNLIVTEGGSDLKLVDFEGAYEIGVDQPTNLHTPGFVSQERLEGTVAGREDDYYAVGAVLFAYLLPVNGLLALKPEAAEEFMDCIERDARLPRSVRDTILVLMKRDAGSKASLAKKPETWPVDCVPSMPQPDPERAPNYSCALDGIVQHLLHIASYERKDRLFPADPKLFATNPLSLAHGATGIAYTLKKVTGSVPQPITDWILSRPIHSESYSPGLYMGLSGIAWVLLEAGEHDQAKEIFHLASEHRLQGQSVDLFHGSAGWGLTSLRFFLETGNELYLQQAIRCANQLLAACGADTSGQDWKQHWNRPLGLAHGASGVALFLLYLYLITRNERFMVAGRNALESDLAAGIATVDGGLSWGSAANLPGVLYPYWRYGSAGVGVAVVRYCKVLGENVYQEALERIFIDTDRNHSVLPGRFSGLAGIGDFMLDAWTFTGNQRYLDRAHRIADALMKFSVKRQGTVFPGDFLNRLSCDYGTGSAGVASFLNRLISRQSADFLLDDLLIENTSDPEDARLATLSKVIATA